MRVLKHCPVGADAGGVVAIGQNSDISDQSETISGYQRRGKEGNPFRREVAPTGQHGSPSDAGSGCEEKAGKGEGRLWHHSCHLPTFFCTLKITKSRRQACLRCGRRSAHLPACALICCLFFILTTHGAPLARISRTRASTTSVRSTAGKRRQRAGAVATSYSRGRQRGKWADRAARLARTVVSCRLRQASWHLGIFAALLPLPDLYRSARCLSARTGVAYFAVLCEGPSL